MQQGLSWYRHDILRFMNGVQGIGPDKIGAYIILMDLIYSRGGKSLRDDRHLAGILGCSSRLARSLTDDLISLGKVEVDGEFLTRNNIENDVKRVRMLSETRVNAGRMGGERSAVSRKNNNLPEAHASTRVEPDKEKEKKERDAIASPKKVGTRLKPDWQLPRLWGEWALVEGLSVPEIRRQAEGFRDFWIAAPKGVKLDWEATWRNWIRKYVDDKQERKGSKNGKTSKFAAAVANAIELDKKGRGDRGDAGEILDAGSGSAGEGSTGPRLVGGTGAVFGG
jgi:uncharacterized protein YdaU (DUF1376 family)